MECKSQYPLVVPDQPKANFTPNVTSFPETLIP